MKTQRWSINSTTDHADVDYGPPLPHSLYLWGVWGCYDERHHKCLALSSLEKLPSGEVDWVTRHESAQYFYEEHIKLCKRSPGCRYFIHWLVGELEEPGHSE